MYQSTLKESWMKSEKRGGNGRLDKTVEIRPLKGAAPRRVQDMDRTWTTPVPFLSVNNHAGVIAGLRAKRTFTLNAPFNFLKSTNMRLLQLWCVSIRLQESDKCLLTQEVMWQRPSDLSAAALAPPLTRNPNASALFCWILKSCFFNSNILRSSSCWPLSCWFLSSYTNTHPVHFNNFD